MLLLSFFVIISIAPFQRTIHKQGVSVCLVLLSQHLHNNDQLIREGFRLQKHFLVGSSLPHLQHISSHCTILHILASLTALFYIFQPLSLHYFTYFSTLHCTILHISTLFTALFCKFRHSPLHYFTYFNALHCTILHISTLFTALFYIIEHCCAAPNTSLKKENCSFWGTIL